MYLTPSLFMAYNYQKVWSDFHANYFHLHILLHIQWNTSVFRDVLFKKKNYVITRITQLTKENGK